MVKKTALERYLFIFIFFFIIFFAVFFRFWGILHHDFGYTYDVGRDFLAIRNMLVEHSKLFLGPTSGQSGVFYGPWWYWLMILPYIVVGGNPAGLVGVVALSGILAMLVMYLFAKNFDNKKFALLTFGIMGFSSFFIGTSSQFWNPNLLILTTSCVLFLLYKIESLSLKKMFLFGFITTLSIELQLYFGTFLFLGILASILIFHRKVLLSKKVLPFFLGIVVIEAPRILFEFKNHFIQTKVLLSVMSGNVTQHYDIVSRLKILAEFFSSIWPNQFGIIASVLTLIFLLIFILLAFKEKNIENKRFSQEIILLIFLYISVTLFYKKDFWNYYLTGFPVLILFPTSYVLYLIFSRIKRFYLLVVLIFLLSYINFSNLKNDIFGKRFIGDASVYRNQEEVVDYLYKQSAGQDFNVTVYTPPIFPYTWDYLFIWYGKNKYGKIPSDKTQKKLYIVIEPDPGYEGRIKDWLKVREGDGEIKNVKAFPSGIIVQSRIRPQL